MPNECFSYSKISLRDLLQTNPNIERIFDRLKADRDILVVFVLGNLTFRFIEEAFKKGVHKYWVVFSNYKDRPGKGMPPFLMVRNSNFVKYALYAPFSNNTVCHPSFLAYQKYQRETFLCMKPPVKNSAEILFTDIQKYEYIASSMLESRFLEFKTKLNNKKLQIFQYPKSIGENVFRTFNESHNDPHLENSKGSKCPLNKELVGKCVRITIREVQPNVFDKQYQWSCHTCTPNHIIDEYGGCHKCIGWTGPNHDSTRCSRYPVLSFQTYYLRYIFCNLCIIAFTMVVYIIFRKTPVVKSSNFALSMIQLMACNLLLVSFFVFMREPTVSRCTLRPVIISTLLAIIVSIVVVKAEKIIIIFFTKTRLTKKDMVTISIRQLVIFIFFVVINVIILRVTLTLPAVVEDSELHKEDGKRLILVRCSTDKQMYVPLIYSAVILLLSIIQGYRGRKLPANYDEGTSICVAASCLFFALIFSIWAMDGSNTVYQKVYLVWISLSVGLTLFVLCLYGPKVFIILFQPDKNTKSYQRRLMLAYALKKVEERTLRPSRRRSKHKINHF